MYEQIITKLFQCLKLQIELCHCKIHQLEKFEFMHVLRERVKKI